MSTPERSGKERRRQDRRQSTLRQAKRRQGDPEPGLTPARSGEERRKADRRQSTLRQGPRRQASAEPGRDNDLAKGAVETEGSGGSNDQVSMTGQLSHRGGDERTKGQDTDFPEPGQSPEHSGQHRSSPTSD